MKKQNQGTDVLARLENLERRFSRFNQNRIHLEMEAHELKEAIKELLNEKKAARKELKDGKG